MNELLEYQLLGNKLRDWLISLSIITGCMVAARIIKSIALVETAVGGRRLSGRNSPE
jgi:hypothetical protein